MTDFSETQQGKKLAQLRKEEEEEFARRRGELMGIPYLNLTSVPISTDALKIIPLEKARIAQLAVIQAMGNKLQVAARNPEAPAAKAELDELKAARFMPQIFIVSARSMEKVWETYKTVPTVGARIAGHIDVSAAQMDSFRTEITSIAILREKIAALAASTISDLLELVIAGALATDASDIHFEPEGESVRIRYRIDGMLTDVSTLPQKTYRFLLGRIKLVSELKLNVQDRAQDGRFTIEAPEGAIEVRVSALPGPAGENIVMRILNPKAIGLSLNDLGMQPWVQSQIEAELKKPNGMLITTGPTGSGKTTSLYAFLKKVHEPGVKIITLEDPIEYHLSGIEQTQIESDRGYDFAAGLRAIMRQDPDVILVGEIRDKETAETAIQAAQTGHLVFSTLHTNNAAGTIPRLMDIGVSPNSIGPAINVAMAQRLVRKLCAKCKTAEPAKPEEVAALEKELAGFPAGVEKPSLATVRLGRPKGCDECRGTGYKGRIGVYEVILIDDAMERLVKQLPSEADIKDAAFKQGQITMRQDGILKIIAGITDFAELERVVG